MLAVTDARLVGLAFIAAAIISMIAAGMPSLARERVWMLPLPAYLSVIRRLEGQWRAHAWCFGMGTVAMGAALALHGAAGDRSAVAAAAVYFLVAPCWLATLAFRLDITVWAAQQDAPPPIYEIVGKWSGSLYAIYMVGGYAVIALLGTSFVGDPRVPGWTGWVLASAGAAMGLSFAAAWPRLAGMRSPFELPVLIQLVPLIAAIPLAAASG